VFLLSFFGQKAFFIGQTGSTINWLQVTAISYTFTALGKEQEKVNGSTTMRSKGKWMGLRACKRVGLSSLGTKLSYINDKCNIPTLKTA
jgi:hypothetical protein